MTSRITTPVVFLIAAACGGGGPVGVEEVENDVVFERENGTVIDFPDETHVWCGPWEAGEIPEPAVHVFVGGVPSGWKVAAVRADVVIGQPNTFPNTFIADDPSGVDMFILDPPNELSTQADDSSGSITFTELNCSMGGAVAFTIDAIVGSEFSDLPSISASGSFRGRVGPPPF